MFPHADSRRHNAKQFGNGLVPAKSADELIYRGDVVFHVAHYATGKSVTQGYFFIDTFTTCDSIPP